MKHFLLFTTFLCFSACGPHEKPAPAATSETPAAAKAKAKFPTHCFEKRDPDGSILSLQYFEYYDQIVGILDYSLYDKDGAHGTFLGKKEGDIITANWTFTIEGSEQEEEIMLRIEGDKASRASGELMEIKGGVLVLKDPAKVKWVEEFTRVSCE